MKGFGIEAPGLVLQIRLGDIEFLYARELKTTAAITENCKRFWCFIYLSST